MVPENVPRFSDVKSLPIWDLQLTLTGFDSSAVTPLLNTDLRETGPASAAQSGAVRSGTDSQDTANDPLLQRVVKAWPRLSAEVKARVLALIAEQGDG